MTYLQLNVPLK